MCESVIDWSKVNGIAEEVEALAAGGYQDDLYKALKEGRPTKGTQGLDPKTLAREAVSRITNNVIPEEMFSFCGLVLLINYVAGTNLTEEEVMNRLAKLADWKEEDEMVYVVRKVAEEMEDGDED